MMKVQAFIESGLVPFISSARHVMQMFLMLLGIWSLIMFAVPVQAYHCGDMAAHQEASAHHPAAAMSHHMHNMSKSKTTMGHDCCSPDCHCPSALCGAGHGAPLSAIIDVPNFGTTELIRFSSDRYSSLPLALLTKPPIAA